MSLIVFEHCASEDSAELGATLQRHGHKLRVIKLYEGQEVPPDTDDVDGIVSMGGPMNVDQQDQHPWLAEEEAYIKQAHDAGTPIVGVCLGAQLIATALGGQVAAMSHPEVGWHELNLAFPGTIDPIFAGIGWQTTQFHIHGQEVTELPPGATPLAGSTMCRNQAYKVGLRTYAFQYHFEWQEKDLAVIVRDTLVSRSDQTAEDILTQADTHFVNYRRLGDRLCERIATTLFPLSKRY